MIPQGRSKTGGRRVNTRANAFAWVMEGVEGTARLECDPYPEVRR